MLGLTLFKGPHCQDIFVKPVAENELPTVDKSPATSALILKLDALWTDLRVSDALARNYLVSTYLEDIMPDVTTSKYRRKGSGGSCPTPRQTILWMVGFQDMSRI